MSEEMGIEEDDICNRNGCLGVLCMEREGSCSCHINPPCSACVDARPVCDKCGWEEIADE